MEWMIYGANGYTGTLIAREAKARGMRPVIAGRNAAKLRPLADELGLEVRTFPLDEPDEVARGLEGIGLVLHCAGPFSRTSAPMIEGCLRAASHYLDITGEISVFEHAYAQDERARDAGVVLCPGVGFDVIPTDCVASALADALPDATQLLLGFDADGGVSPGTARTAAASAGEGGRIRRDGQLIKVPLGYAPRRIDFGRGTTTAMTIPWGDVVTAHFGTGIPNIAVYVPVRVPVIALARMANLLRPVLRAEPVRRALKALAGRYATGPDEATRDRGATHVWGEVRNAGGEARTARIITANAYALTVTGSLAVVQNLLEAPVAGGSYTPSMLLGPQLVESLPGSGPIRIMRSGDDATSRSRG